MYKICFYVPESHLEIVKMALFNAGAGRQGLYEHCCWQSKGEGQFRPMIGSNPFIGDAGELEVVSEYKVEMVCMRKFTKDAVEALKQAHPYEEPAFDVSEIISV
ncbi:Nif3-like dinuclear metal center hexameric protein [Alkalimarinus alittae]|uniref:YqfO family protein n=1 Tax=Alkalimarinus alittae TaxID=2961619 RepID=A0ABY6MYJ1_9ALTE|nr:YqfO family protein [Alkalimarinus alittae]UZE94903.1 YqfO family protein [Alkalimarinus alittae]